MLRTVQHKKWRVNKEQNKDVIDKKVIYVTMKDNESHESQENNISVNLV